MEQAMQYSPGGPKVLPPGLQVRNYWLGLPYCPISLVEMLNCASPLTAAGLVFPFHRGKKNQGLAKGTA